MFHENQPSGTFLVLQLRGTEGELRTVGDAGDVAVDLTVNELLQAERFAIPVLLVRVPVNNTKKRFFFLWLQEYAHVVLDREDDERDDGKSWRTQRTTTVRIPVENVSSDPRFSACLRDIAAEPVRVAALGELAYLAHELRWADNNLERLLELFDKLFSIRGLSYPPHSPWAQEVRELPIAAGSRVACCWATLSAPRTS